LNIITMSRTAIANGTAPLELCRSLYGLLDVVNSKIQPEKLCPHMHSRGDRIDALLMAHQS